MTKANRLVRIKRIHATMILTRLAIQAVDKEKMETRQIVINGCDEGVITVDGRSCYVR